MSIDKLDAKGVEFTAELLVKNPNSYKIQIVSTDADVFLSNRFAGKAKLLDKVVIPANFNSTITARVRTDFDQGSMALLPLILGAAVKKKIDLRVDGTVRAKSFLIGRNFDFDYSHEGSL